jgi:hypothetical protein
VLEVVVPQPPGAGRGEKSRVFGHLIKHSAPYRYVWSSELDLMAKLAGLRLQHRWANWHRATFGPDSPAHVSVYAKPAYVAMHETMTS